MRVDLHLHTTASDGSDTPRELVRLAKDKGLSVIAITDHDTIAGLSELTDEDKEGIKLITGIEFSCYFKGKKGGFNCHILGYGFDTECEELQAAIAHGRQMRLFKLEARLEYLKSTFDIEFSDDEISELRGYNSVAKPHLAALIVKHGLAVSIDEAIDKYLLGAKFPDDRIPAAEAISAISAAGGISVYAHPLGGEREKRIDKDTLERRVLRLKGAGLDGVECYYSRYNEQDSEVIRAIAEEHGMCISAGSDYHGKNKTVPLGEISASGGGVDITKITVLTEIGRKSR